jgi:FKBP-type peptidyl-prolyl cis-trans isomerase
VQFPPRRTAFLAALTLVAAGCDAPKMMPVAPPGLTYEPMVVEKDEDKAQAIGETRTASARAPGSSTAAGPAPAPATPTAAGQPTTTASGLVYETLQPGNGADAAWGKTIRVHYTGTLTNGTQFDTSRKPNGQPFSLTLGAGQVIPGWEEGLQGMKVGEKRKLTIPAKLAYGEQGRPPQIPTNSTLVFEVELIGVD